MNLRRQFLFGLVDGLNGAVGLIVGLMASHAAPTIIFVAIMSRAGSSSVSMAGAQYESDDTPQGRWLRVLAMGAGYLTSAILPGVGFAFGVGVPVFVFATPFLLALIASFRASAVGWYKSLTTTLLIFALAVSAGLLASLL